MRQWRSRDHHAYHHCWVLYLHHLIHRKMSTSRDHDLVNPRLVWFSNWKFQCYLLLSTEVKSASKPAWVTHELKHIDIWFQLHLEFWHFWWVIRQELSGPPQTGRLSSPSECIMLACPTWPDFGNIQDSQQLWKIQYCPDHNQYYR